MCVCGGGGLFDLELGPLKWICNNFWNFDRHTNYLYKTMFYGARKNIQYREPQNLIWRGGRGWMKWIVFLRGKNISWCAKRIKQYIATSVMSCRTVFIRRFFKNSMNYCAPTCWKIRFCKKNLFFKCQIITLNTQGIAGSYYNIRAFYKYYLHVCWIEKYAF